MDEVDRPSRVLVVDDDEPVRHMLALTFELEGFDVAQAADGLDAIVRIGLFDPDVVVLDIMMPRMDGLTVLGHLRRQAATATLPVVLLSAKADSTDIAIGMRAGASDYVTKPFEADDLLERTRRALAAAPRTALVPASAPPPEPAPPTEPTPPDEPTPDLTAHPPPPRELFPAPSDEHPEPEPDLVLPDHRHRIRWLAGATLMILLVRGATLVHL
jgi:DNA-binding response OmpR family regulator